MNNPVALFFKAWRGFREFKALPPEARAIVFYAEDGGSWLHFEPIIHELIHSHHQSLCYLTSSPDDPVLSRRQENIKAFYIGSGVVRIIFFMMLRAGVMVMTMPDLQTFHLKRSYLQSVHYVYVYHSLCSTHMIYRPDAFHHFDAICCVGPFQAKEIRSTEAYYKLKPKTLVEHGYGCLDTLLNQTADQPEDRVSGQPLKVLVAPSWGEHALLETRGKDLVEILLKAGYRVVVRPHPETTHKRPDVVTGLSRQFANEPNFVLETDIASKKSLRQSDVMISDWSGVAFEYAFSRERPVLYVDVPRKVNNPEYEKIFIEPFEAYIRSEIGEIVLPDRLEEIPKYIERLTSNPHRFQEHIRKVRSEQIFNIGRSGAAGAQYIQQAAENSRTHSKRVS